VKLLEKINLIPERLARVSSRKRIIKELDGLRFLAAFPVVIQHLSERVIRSTGISFSQGTEFYVSSFLASRGFVGVYIFFIVSGFVVALPFANHLLYNSVKVDTWQYYKNRFSRIIPPYAVALISFFIVLLLLRYYTFSELWSHFLASLFFLHNLIFNGWSPINPTIWTLEIQVQFYCLMPFLALLIYSFRSTSYRRSIILIVILLLHLYQGYSGILTGWGYLNILGNLQYFLAGIFLADIYLVEWINGYSKSYIYDLVAIGTIIGALFAWNWDHNIYNRLLFLLLLFFFFYSMFRSMIINRFLSNKWIMMLGSMCFTIYLVHLPLAELFIYFTKNIRVTNSLGINILIQFLLYLPVLILVSTAYFILIEKPTMKGDWLNKVQSWFSQNGKRT